MQTQQMQVVGGGALSAYRSREEVRELGERMQIMMPGAQRLSEPEAMAVAQISVLHGLNPFNGEVWGLKGKDGRWYGVMVGVKGLRKTARRQIDKDRGKYWIEFTKVLPEKYDETEDAVVYECRLRDNVTLEKWNEGLRTLINSGATYQEAIEQVGPAPVSVGVGIARPGERSVMAIDARAMKRAEAEAIKKRFDVKVQFDADRDEHVGTVVIDGVRAEPYAGPSAPDTKTVDPLWNDEPARPIPPEELKEQLILWSNMYIGQPCQPSHRKMLASALTGIFEGDDTRRYEFCKYYLEEASTNAMRPEMVLAALKTWMEITRWGESPSDDCVSEARAGHAYALKEMGQIEMEFESAPEVAY